MGKGKKAAPDSLLTGSNAKKLERRKRGKSDGRILLFARRPSQNGGNLFKRPQIIGRGFSSGLRGGHKQRLAACQAGLKQFQLPDLYTFRKEEVYYFPQRCQWNRMWFTFQQRGLARGEWIHAKATCQEASDTFIQRAAGNNAYRKVRMEAKSWSKEEMANRVLTQLNSTGIFLLHWNNDYVQKKEPFLWFGAKLSSWTLEASG